MNLVEDIVRSAGKYLAEEYRIEQRPKEKARYDLVTSSDTTVETFLVKELHALFPDDGFHGEELGNCKGTSGRRWIIDPIDGTADFVFGVPYFSISLALENSDGIEEGYVYNPIADEFYHSSLKEGKSFLNGKEIHVSDTNDLSESLIAFGFSAHMDHMDRYIAEWGPLMICCRKALPLITPALTICNVARGRIDAYIDYGSSVEGKAAAGLILQNAGGVIRNYHQDSYSYRMTGHICTNGKIDVGYHWNG